MTIQPHIDAPERKLIILYILYKIAQSMTVEQLMSITLEPGWMTYFDLRDHLLDLETSGLISASIMDHRSLYVITSDGMNVLRDFLKRIPFSIRTLIDQQTLQSRKAFQRQMVVLADYTQESAMDYPITLKLVEQQQVLFSFELVAPTASQAEAICKKFREEGPSIYASLLQQLTMDSDVEDTPTAAEKAP